MNPDWRDPDDAPDLTDTAWEIKLADTPVRRGRPSLPNSKVSTTIRLDEAVVSHFRSGGPGWQSRINTALKEWIISKPLSKRRHGSAKTSTLVCIGRQKIKNRHSRLSNAG
eukprot:gene646-903_t